MRERTIEQRRVSRVAPVLPVPGNDQVARRNLVLEPGRFAAVDPFLIMSEDWFAAAGGFDPHPHRGIETVTFVLDGAVEHRDNRGHRSVIHAGDAQWMTAGRGIIHSERAHGGATAHTLQLWINLPSDRKMVEPRYQALRAADMPVHRSGGAEIRIFSGTAGDQTAPTLNHWPITLLEIAVAAGAEATVDLAGADRGFLLALAGHGRIGAREEPIRAGEVAWLADADPSLPTELHLEADDALRLLLWSGPRIREPVVARGPFIMSSMEEIAQAEADLRDGGFGPLEVE